MTFQWTSPALRGVISFHPGNRVLPYSMMPLAKTVCDIPVSVNYLHHSKLTSLHHFWKAITHKLMKERLRSQMGMISLSNHAALTEIGLRDLE